MATKSEACQNPDFIKADEVAIALDVSKSQAYKIMQKLNLELKLKGIIVTSGRISRRYLEERCFFRRGCKQCK